MAKITRYQGNLKSFASESLGTERTIFGAETQSDVLTDNITVNFLRGWGIVGVNENPTKQDFNGLAFTLGQLLAYIHQHGVAEWHVEQEYPEHAVCQHGGVIYFSTEDANIGNIPGTDPEWRLIPASDISFDNTGTDLDAETVQAAIIELRGFVGSGTPIGGYVTVQTDLTGAEEPDPATHIKLEAGLTGAGQYNEGKLGSESVTGSAPLVVATAQITDAESPLNGQTVHLLETERRFFRAGLAGTVENDQMQQITGAFDLTRAGSLGHTGVFTGTNDGNASTSGSATGVGDRTVLFASADSPDARVSDTTDGETRAKNIGVSVYMRIK